MLDDCAVCGAPLEHYLDSEGEPYRWQAFGAGFGPTGTECVVGMERVRCAAGHIYDRETGSVQW